jgi:hypothetical protein
MLPTMLLASAATAVLQLVDEKLGNEETSFSFKDAEKIADEVGIHVSTIIRLGQEAGLTYVGRETPRKVRGFRSNSNDRWFGIPFVREFRLAANLRFCRG